MKYKVYDISWNENNLPSELPTNAIVDAETPEEIRESLHDKYGYWASKFRMREMKNRPNLISLTQSICNAMSIALDRDYRISLIGASELIDDNDNLYCDSLWHGGSMITLTKGNIMISIDAVGDVEASLFDADGDEIASVKDRNNAGLFRDELGHEIHGDNELISIEDGSDRKNRTLYFANNNWYEVFIFQKRRFVHSDVIDGDINDIMNDLDSIISWSEDMLKMM